MAAADDLKKQGETSELRRNLIIRQALRLGCDTKIEGPHFELEVAAEFLAARGWTFSNICRAQS